MKFGTTINVDTRAKIQVKNVSKKVYIWRPAKCACQNGKYLGSIIENSVTCGVVAVSFKREQN